MTEEVTDAMARMAEAYIAATGHLPIEAGIEAIASLAMRSASNSPTTNGEVSEPLDDAEVERLAQLNPIYEGFKEQSVGLNIRTHVRAIAANLAMRSASNSPTTNGEVSEPGLSETPFAYAYRYPSSYRPGETEIRLGTNGREINGSKPIEAIPLYTRASLTPRAASDDEVECVARAIEQPFLPHGYKLKPHLLNAAARAAITALSTPTKASAVDDPETAKGGE